MEDKNIKSARKKRAELRFESRITEFTFYLPGVSILYSSHPAPPLLTQMHTSITCSNNETD